MFLLFLFSLSFACNGSTTFPVAAVSDGGQGTIMDLTLRAAPGNGSVFISIPPYSGTDLQRSISQAVDYADVGECDIFVEFTDYSGTSYVDGPSAGAAMASISYILANGLPIVNKPVITGAVSNSGSVLPVGGIYEKALVSAASGVESFLVPKTNLYDYIMLKKVEELHDLNIVVVASIEETVDYITGKEVPSGPEYPDFESPAENITAYYGRSLDEFAIVAEDIIEFENYTVNELGDDGAEEWLVNYFRDSIDENNRLLGLGYAYTAANNAFLGYIDLSTIVFVYTGEPSYQEKAYKISSCVSEIERPMMTSDNFEWVIGSDLRKAWAEEKLNSSEIRDEHLIEEEYTYYHEIMYADAWCRASGALSEVAFTHKGGHVLNESSLKQLAEDYLDTANITKHNPETQRRFNIALSLYEEGKYSASIFDAVYVASMDLGELELSDMEEEEIEDAVHEMLLMEPESLWANIYRSQAVYLIEKDTPEYETAYSLLLFSAYLDEAVSLMQTEMQPVSEEPAEASDWTELLMISASFILFFFVLVYILPKIFRRLYEGKDNKAGRTNGRKRKSSSKSRVYKAKRTGKIRKTS